MSIPPPPAAMPDPKDYSEALARGIRILSAFDAERPSLTMAAIAQAVGLPRATTRRALITLVHLGYIEEEHRQYRLRPKVMELAASYLSASPVTAILQPACERLATRFGETFSIATLDGSHAVMIAYARPRSLYGDRIGIGLRLPAFCSAVGRVLLAGRTADQRQQLLAGERFEAMTDRTVTDPAAVDILIDAARSDGNAFVADEVELGFCSMAVPVRRRGGDVLYALNVGMPSARANAATLRDQFLAPLAETAAALQRQLL